MPSGSDGVDAAASSNMNPGQLDPLDSVLETGRERSLLLASVRYLLVLSPYSRFSYFI